MIDAIAKAEAIASLPHRSKAARIAAAWAQVVAETEPYTGVRHDPVLPIDTDAPALDSYTPAP